MVKTYLEIDELQQAIEEHQSTIELIQEAAAMEITKDPENEDKIVETFKPRCEYFKDKIELKVNVFIVNILQHILIHSFNFVLQ